MVIGGGTGSYTALRGLKRYPLELTAIVTMMDSGGSSGRLRDELGVLPPADIKQCLVALSNSSSLLRELFNYRFENGGLKGHSFGNIFVSALEKTTGSFKKAIDEVGKILQIKGQVIPVTFTKSDLCVELIDGRKIVGETHIDVVEKKEERAPIKRAYLSKKTPANKDATDALLKADFIVIGPGDLYTSIIPNLLVDQIAAAIKRSKAKKIFVMNLMTKYGQTTRYKAENHIADLEKYLGKNVVDAILVNKNTPDKKTLSWYKKFGEEPVTDDLSGSGYRIIRKNLIKTTFVQKKKADSLRRSFIRHDPDKLAKALMEIIAS